MMLAVQMAVLVIGMVRAGIALSRFVSKITHVITELIVPSGLTRSPKFGIIFVTMIIKTPIVLPAVIIVPVEPGITMEVLSVQKIMGGNAPTVPSL